MNCTGTHLRARTLLLWKRGASEAEKDDEKGTSHAQNGVAESGRGRTNATSREPAWSEPELPARERYAGLVATAWQ